MNEDPTFRRPRRPALGLLAALPALLAWGCGCAGEESPRGKVPRVEYLELRTPEASAAPAESLRKLRELEVSKPSTWTVRGASQRVARVRGMKDEEPPLALVLSEPETKTFVTLPGPFDPQAFNLVAVHFQATAKFELGVDFMRGDDRASYVPPRVIPPEGGKGPRTLLIEAPHLRRVDGELDGIQLRILGVRHSMQLRGVDLCWQPDIDFLATPADGPQPVQVGAESRSSVGVSSEAPVVTSLTAEPDALLRFSYGTPGELTRAGSEAQLRLELRPAAGEARVEHFPLDTNFRKTRWRQALIHLADLPAGALEAEWRVEAHDGGGAVCALGEVSLVRPGTSNRNVLLVTSDTHRGDHLGLAGEGVDVETPHIDALAERGIYFEDCFSTTNITNPSHIALMTGVHPRDTGIVNNYTRVAAAAPTLAEAFRDAGYITYAAVSTRHLSDATSGLGQGFERSSFPLRNFDRDGAETIEVLADWMEESEGLPVFAWLHLFDAHMPYDKGVPRVGRYYDGDAFRESLPELGSPVEKAIRHLGLEGLRDLDYPRALYKAEITRLDERLGELLDSPPFAGAVIAFTADHGESLGNHQIYFAHEELYRESLHVPMILAWPGGPRGVRSPRPVTNIDLGRTLLDLSGNSGVDFPGENLALLLEQEEGASAARFSLSAHAREVSLTEDGWHLQLRLGPNDLADGTSTRERHQVELYFLPEDPDCLRDLLDAELPRAAEMRVRVLRWLEEQASLDWIGGDSGDSATLAQLTALGYAGGDAASSGASLAVDRECDCKWCARFD